MLEGAMRELRIGDTRSLATDVGPVIDREAQSNLEQYITRWRAKGAPVFALPLPPECMNGTFVAPALIEISHPEQLTREVFGPVLHVVRFREDELPQLIDALNAAGYGLTHGIQTRIDETVDLVSKRIRAGNIYVNRNIIGAVVGVQPFGGEALSGTGPKAGGPHYLWRLVRETRPPRAGDEVALPGPTGETNTLLLRPRGRVACLASTEAELRAQARLTTQLGNIALLPASTAGDDVCAGLGAGCVTVADPLAAAPDAVLFAGADVELAALRKRLAAQDGPLVPLLVAHEGAYDAMRLVSERTVTINTTASGGNASLLSLEEEEPA
jgi:RHH-type proline utilization regulon transcriptional repressor/proline dehydrogenase/delta 1-pyrroline-5-carboxylate dehydrogenase